jgi:predicted heme/steroid binding protein
MANKRFIQIVGFGVFLVALSFCVSPPHLKAKEEYAELTGKDCEICHKDPSGGPDLTRYGDAFQRGGYQYPIPPEAFQSLPLFKRVVRFLIGFLHLAAGIVWFGTIFYVHVIITPQALTRGLPKSEMILGWVCIIITGVTGTLLSISRLSDISQLYTMKFGIILSIKITLYLVMVGIAVFTTTVIRKKMKLEIRRQEEKKSTGSVLTHTDLISYSGSDQQPAYIAAEGTVYDVSESPAWREGRHMGQHFAGKDLTDELLSAPHGREVLERLKKVGKLWEGAGRASLPVSGVKKTFLVLAKLTLVIALLIVLCIAMWRWG